MSASSSSADSASVSEAILPVIVDTSRLARSSRPDLSVERLHMASVNYLDGRIDVYAYLVVTESDVVLIDTGVGEGHPYIEKKFQPQLFLQVRLSCRSGDSSGRWSHKVLVSEFEKGQAWLLLSALPQK